MGQLSWIPCIGPKYNHKHSPKREMEGDLNTEEKPVWWKSRWKQRQTEKMLCHWLCRWRKGPWGKGMDSPLEPLKGVGFNFNLKQPKCILLRFWSPQGQTESQGDKSRCQQGWFLLENLEVNLFLASCRFWRRHHYNLFDHHLSFTPAVVHAPSASVL